MRAASRVLVTGGAGFVGANLVRRIADRYDVRVLDSLVTGEKDHLPTGIELLVGDVRDPEAVAEAMAGAAAVVHLAAAGSVIDSVDDPLANFDVNVRGTLGVLDAARAAGVDRVVFASTGGALVGHAAGPVDEASAPRPISPYGASKAAAEAYCSAYAGSFGLRTICLRFANLYGPYSAHKKGVVPSFFRALHAGDPLIVYGHATRDFMHVHDICDALQRALAADVPGGTTVHVATGVETGIDRLAAMCAAVAGRPDHPVEHRGARTGEVGRNVAGHRLATELLGFRPSVALSQGLLDTWDWYREHVFR